MSITSTSALFIVPKDIERQGVFVPLGKITCRDTRLFPKEHMAPLHFFREWLEARIAEEGGSESAVAKRMGFPPNYIHKWRQGREPSLGNWIRALDAYGYDVMNFPPGLLKPGVDGFGDTLKALQEFKANGWRLNSRGASPVRHMEIIGQVSAGSAQFREVPPEHLTFDVKEWKPARLWPHTRPLDDGRDGTFIRIVGNSMEPNYPDGALLACRLPGSVIPQGTPAILSILARNEQTFKMISVRYEGKKAKEIIAVPINREHTLQYYKPKDVEIQYIVLGFVHLKIDVTTT